MIRDIVKKLKCPMCARNDRPYYNWKKIDHKPILYAYCVGCGKPLGEAEENIHTLALAPDRPIYK